MKIILIRHFKVNYKWKLFYNSAGYDKARKEYDTCAVIKSKQSLQSNPLLYSSTLPRALETSRLMFGKEPNICTESLCEVPLRSFLNSALIFPKFIWDIIGRIQWITGNTRQPEIYNQSVSRADTFLNHIIADNKDCVIISHGWIIKLMIKLLKTKGFSGPRPVFIKTGVSYEFVK